MMKLFFDRYLLEWKHISAVVRSHFYLIAIFLLISSVIGLLLENKSALMGLTAAHKISLAVLLLVVLTQILIQILLIGRLVENKNDLTPLKNILIHHGVSVFIYASLNEIITGLDYFFSVQFAQKNFILFWIAARCVNLLSYALIFLIWFRYFNKYRKVLYGESHNPTIYLREYKLHFAVGAAIYMLSQLFVEVPNTTWLSSAVSAVILLNFWITLSAFVRSRLAE